MNFKLRILSQILQILLVWLLGETAAKVLQIPIPGNVIGMILMLLFLVLKVIKVEKIKQVSDFFTQNIAFFFIPSTVALMVNYKVIENSIVAALVAIVLTNILVFLVTGLTAEWLLRLKDKRKGKDNGNS